MINFISNLPSNTRTGGITARNVGALEALSMIDAINYVGPINPPIFQLEKFYSKVPRIVGLSGDFYFFSRRRLRVVASHVQRLSLSNARLDFFHGFTPWILTRPSRPYIAWSDCTFHDYINIFHNRQEFREVDLCRIERMEADWLKQARQVIFRSQWAMKRAIEHYGLDPERVRSVSNFGEIKPPIEDVYGSGQTFLFVSTDFAAKGGYEVLEAFQVIRSDYPGAKLVIVGDEPKGRIGGGGILVTGYLRKEVDAEARELCKLLSEVRALVHPTKKDTNPAILVEAAYFGCPVIASRQFAISETVDDGRTGLLLQEPLSIGKVVMAMRWMLDAGEAYHAMRRAAWQKSRRDHSRERFLKELKTCVEEVLGGGK